MRAVKQLKSGFIAAFILLCACAQTNAVSRSDPTAEDIIANYKAALGGENVVKNIKTVQIWANYEEPKYQLVTPTRVYKKRPDFRVVELPEINLAEGFNGASWEYHGSDDEIIWTEGAAEEATRRGAEFDESVIDWKEKGHAVEFVGPANVFGVETWEIKVTLADGWEKTYYFDTSSYLIVARKKAMPIHATGDNVETITHIEDYRVVEGVKFPFVETEYRTDDDMLLNKLVTERIVVNQPLPDDMFSPEATRKRLMADRAE